MRYAYCLHWQGELPDCPGVYGQEGLPQAGRPGRPGVYGPKGLPQEGRPDRPGVYGPKGLLPAGHPSAVCPLAYRRACR
jgi:hypothetical protein